MRSVDIYLSSKNQNLVFYCVSTRQQKYNLFKLVREHSYVAWWRMYRSMLDFPISSGVSDSHATTTRSGKKRFNAAEDWCNWNRDTEKCGLGSIQQGWWSFPISWHGDKTTRHSGKNKNDIKFINFGWLPWGYHAEYFAWGFVQTQMPLVSYGEVLPSINIYQVRCMDIQEVWHEGSK